MSSKLLKVAPDRLNKVPYRFDLSPEDEDAPYYDLYNVHIVLATNGDQILLQNAADDATLVLDNDKFGKAWKLLPLIENGKVADLANEHKGMHSNATMNEIAIAYCDRLFADQKGFAKGMQYGMFVQEQKGPISSKKYLEAFVVLHYAELPTFREGKGTGLELLNMSDLCGKVQEADSYAVDYDDLMKQAKEMIRENTTESVVEREFPEWPSLP